MNPLPHTPPHPLLENLWDVFAGSAARGTGRQGRGVEQYLCPIEIIQVFYGGGGVMYAN